MHHSTQNFNDSMRARLEDIVYTKSSIIFSGHDHYHATQRISYNDSQAVAVFCGGALSNKGDWRNSEFFTCLFDTDSFQCDRYKCCLAQTDRGKFYKIDSEPSIRVLQWESMSLLLELYYSAILNAYKPNSYLHLINSEYVDFGKADTYKIERILAHELAGKIDVFISECEKVYDHRVSVKNTMIRRMVRHLMMTSKKISKGQMDKAKSVFLNDQKQPDILFLRASNSSD